MIPNPAKYTSYNSILVCITWRDNFSADIFCQASSVSVIQNIPDLLGLGYDELYTNHTCSDPVISRLELNVTFNELNQYDPDRHKREEKPDMFLQLTFHVFKISRLSALRTEFVLQAKRKT